MQQVKSNDIWIWIAAYTEPTQTKIKLNTIINKVCQSKWKPIVEPRRAKPKTYRQAQHKNIE